MDGVSAGPKRAARLALACLSLTGAAAAAPAPAPAPEPQRTPFQISCEDQPDKTVARLKVRQSGYSVDASLPFRALTEMKGGASGGTFVPGLTKAEPDVDIGLEGPILQDPASDYECVAPRITVRLSYLPIVIYVGKEFKPGSCAYKEILAHELRHMKTYQDHLATVEEVVRAALGKRFPPKPLYARRGSANTALVHEIDTTWMPYIKTELAKVEELQAAIDSPQELARMGKLCGGQIPDILRAPAPKTPAATARNEKRK